MKKKFKSIFALMLALALVFSLAACGSSDTEEDTDTEATAEDTADADTSEVTGDNIEIVLSTSKNETELAGMVLAYFADYVEAATDTITFSRNFGGTLYSSSEELDALSSGAIGVCALSHSEFSDYLPLLQFPNFAQDSNENGLSYMQYMILESDAADLLASEAEEMNIKYLNVIAGGSTVLCCTFEWDSLEETFSKKLGTGVNASAFESIGFSVVSMEVADGYEDLSRGVIDFAVMSFAPTVSLGWYEAAPYYYYTGTHSAGNPISINLDVWNSLSESQQALLEEAAAAAAEYSLEITDTQEDEYIATVEDAGGFVKEMSEDDAAYYFQYYYEAIATDSYARAEDLGITDDMQTVLNASADYLGVDVSGVYE